MFLRPALDAFYRLDPRIRIIILTFATGLFYGNNRSAYIQNSKINHSDVVVFRDSNHCEAKPTLLPWSQSSSSFFKKECCLEIFSTPATVSEKPESLQQVNTKLLTPKIMKMIKEYPELEAELSPFLDCSKIRLVHRHPGTPEMGAECTIELQTKDTFKPLLTASKNELVFVRPPQFTSKESMSEYRAQRTVSLLPKQIRDLVLVNKKLMKLFGDENTKIVETRTVSSHMNYIVKVKTGMEEPKLLIFQQTYLGYWRYAGDTPDNSMRSVFLQCFGRSPI
jgi:hypothetical protein